MAQGAKYFLYLDQDYGNFFKIINILNFNVMCSLSNAVGRLPLLLICSI